MRVYDERLSWYTRCQIRQERPDSDSGERLRSSALSPKNSHHRCSAPNNRRPEPLSDIVLTCARIFCLLPQLYVSECFKPAPKPQHVQTFSCVCFDFGFTEPSKEKS